MDAAFSLVCEVFGFRTLKDYQRNALKFVIEKNQDVLLILQPDLINLLFFKPYDRFIHV